MTLTRDPSGRRASHIGLELIHAAADLADDALADGEQLCIVPKADIGLDRLAADFDEGLARAVDHDIGDVVACEKRLQRPVAQNVIADVFEQFFLLGNRHGEVLDRDDIVDDITNFLARAFRVELGELREIDRIDKGGKYLALGIIVVFRAGAFSLRGRWARGGLTRDG